MNEQQPSYVPEITLEDIERNAACRGENPELFFAPEKERQPSRELRQALAIEICRRCEVMKQCGIWAVKTDQEHGIWGGMTEDTRTDIKRRLRNRP